MALDCEIFVRNKNAGPGSKLHGISKLSESVLQRFCPHLMHLALDFYSVVDVSITQVTFSFPVMVCLSGEGELRFGKAKSLERSD